MDSQFKRVIKLIKKTGDKVIVFDSNEPENTYAIMSLDEYEKISDNKGDLRGLTEDEMIDKINRDIALWKNDTNDDESIDTENKELPNEEALKTKKSWSIPANRKKAAEEIIEEDRQYLEEINY